MSLLDPSLPSSPNDPFSAPVRLAIIEARRGLEFVARLVHAARSAPDDPAALQQAVATVDAMALRITGLADDAARVASRRGTAGGFDHLSRQLRELAAECENGAALLRAMSVRAGTKVGNGNPGHDESERSIPCT